MFKAARLIAIFLTVAVSPVLSFTFDEREAKAHSASIHDAFQRYLDLHGVTDDNDVNTKSGSSITFSPDKETVAMGTWWESGEGRCSGQIQVYKNSDIGEWNLLNNHIDFEGNQDGCNTSSQQVSLINDGNVILIGNSSASVGRLDSPRHAEAYQNDGEVWEQVHVSSLIGKVETSPFRRELYVNCNQSNEQSSTSAKIGGTCSELKEVAQQCEEGKECVSKHGVTIDPQALRRQCPNRRALQETTDADTVFLELTIVVTQEFNVCVPYKTKVEVVESVETEIEDFIEEKKKEAVDNGTTSTLVLLEPVEITGSDQCPKQKKAKKAKRSKGPKRKANAEATKKKTKATKATKAPKAPKADIAFNNTVV